MSELYPTIECSECFCDIDDNCELNIWNTIKTFIPICSLCIQKKSYKECKQCKHFSINSNICYKCTS